MRGEKETNIKRRGQVYGETGAGAGQVSGEGDNRPADNWQECLRRDIERRQPRGQRPNIAGGVHF